MNNTVRKYSRSLSDAFADIRADSGDWDHPREKWTEIGWRVVHWFSAIGSIVLVIVLLWKT